MRGLSGLTTYFQGVLAEVRKVVWPTPAQLLRYFLSVALGIALATAFVGGVDYVFYHLLTYFIK